MKIDVSQNIDHIGYFYCHAHLWYRRIETSFSKHCLTANILQRSIDTAAQYCITLLHIVKYVII